MWGEEGYTNKKNLSTPPPIWVYEKQRTIPRITALVNNQLRLYFSQEGMHSIPYFCCLIGLSIEYLSFII